MYVRDLGKDIVYNYVKSCRAEYKLVQGGKIYQPTEIHSNYDLKRVIKEMDIIKDIKNKDDLYYCNYYELYLAKIDKYPNLVHTSEKTQLGITNQKEAEFVTNLRNDDPKGYSKYIKDNYPELFYKDTEIAIKPSMGYKNIVNGQNYLNILAHKNTKEIDNAMADLEFIVIYLEYNQDMYIEAIKKIKDFTKGLVGETIFNENKLLMYHYIDTKTEFSVFYYLDVYSSVKYFDYVILQKLIPLEIYAQLNDDEKKVNHSEPLYLNRGFKLKEISAKKIDLQNLIKIEPDLLKKIKNNLDELRIINNGYNANRVHTYCSRFFLVEFQEKYYEISLKSVTAEILANAKNQKNSIALNFIEKYIETLKQLNDIHIDQYTIEDTINYYTDLPIAFEIFVRQVEEQSMPKLLVKKESKEEYDTKLLNIKKSANPDYTIILHLCWKSEFRKIVKKYNNKFTEMQIKDYLFDFTNIIEYEDLKKLKELTSEILLNPILGLYIMDNQLLDKNYIICSKMASTNLKVLWFIITSYNKGVIQKISHDKIQKIADEMICNNTNDIKFEKLINLKINSPKEFMKQFINIYKESVLYKILWYCPENLEITNYDAFINDIKLINKEYKKQEIMLIKEYENNNILELHNILDKYSRSFSVPMDNTKKEYIGFIGIEKTTNFRYLFSKDNFIHNIRHITRKDWKEINSIFKIYEKDNFLNVVYHYPNAALYSIFHMHIYPGNSRFSTIKETSGGRLNVLNPYVFIWYFNRYIDFRYKTISIKTIQR